MRLYLDDDSASGTLVELLRREGHDVQTPGEASLEGSQDPVHLAYAIQEARVFLSGNHNDFAILHRLVSVSRGTHPGILIVRKDNNPTRDLSPRGIARAIRSQLASGMELQGQFLVLNHWR
jgi:predicted nuclease of predicted toxin-antitoxin system